MGLDGAGDQWNADIHKKTKVPIANHICKKILPFPVGTPTVTTAKCLVHVSLMLLDFFRAALTFKNSLFVECSCHK